MDATSLSHTPALIDERRLAQLLVETQRPVIVASHFAGWAEPWLALDDDDWRALRHELGEDVELARIESGANREFAKNHGIEILPEVLVFRDGRVEARLHGRVGAARVSAALSEVNAREEARGQARSELLAAERARQPLSLQHSLLRRRTDARAEHTLAHAS